MVLSFKIGTPALCAVLLVASGCTSTYNNTVSRDAEDFSAAVPPACTLNDQEQCNKQVLSLRDAQREVVYATRADVIVTTNATTDDHDDTQEMATSGDSATIRKAIENDTLENAPTLGQ